MFDRIDNWGMGLVIVLFIWAFTPRLERWAEKDRRRRMLKKFRRLPVRSAENTPTEILERVPAFITLERCGGCKRLHAPWESCR